MTVSRAAEISNAQAPIIVCNSDHRFLVRAQCAEIGVDPLAILLEPVGRNTAPAIALAALQLTSIDPNAIMAVMPADHVIEQPAKFAIAVAHAAQAAATGDVVTFGIVPTHPETGYGYIEIGCSVAGSKDLYKVRSFVEKPDSESAISYLESKTHAWNSGIFVVSASVYLEELKTYRPDIYVAAFQSWENSTVDMGFIRPEAASFIDCPAESIDYAVMQSTKKSVVVMAEFGWSDIGSWEALWEISEKEALGNYSRGDTHLSNTTNSYVRAESRLVAVIGLDNVVVVETKDAVLIMRKDQSQDIRGAIEHFERMGRREHLEHVRMHRPWGWYEGIDHGDRYQVKRILVKPGQQLSLQMHHHRAEHWIVVSGTAKVRVEENETLLSENQSIYIPLGQVHCLENPGKLDLVLIEVQSGQYLGEDDIVRFSDAYGRNSNS